MKYIIVAFKSRNSLQKFVYYLKNNGIFCKIVNTPSNISSSCSLSAKLEFRNYADIISIFNRFHFENLIGVFLISQSNANQSVLKLL